MYFFIPLVDKCQYVSIHLYIVCINITFNNMNQLTKNINQLNADEYIITTNLKTSFKVNLNDLKCECNKTNCDHLKNVYSRVYKIRKPRILRL